MVVTVRSTELHVVRRVVEQVLAQQVVLAVLS
jgi:hypothetical protein